MDGSNKFDNLPPDFGIKDNFPPKNHDISSRVPYQNSENVNYSRYLDLFKDPDSWALKDQFYTRHKDDYSFLNRVNWNVLSPQAPEAVYIGNREAAPLKDAHVDQAVDFLASLYLLDSKVRSRFCSELKTRLADNDIYYSAFKRIAESDSFRNAHQLLYNIPDLLELTDNPKFRIFMGNALVRAQLADQYNTDYKSQRKKAFLKTTGNRVLFMNNSAADSLLGDDPTSLVILENLFREGVVVIRSAGGIKDGKQAEHLIDGQLDKAREIFTGEDFLAKMIDYSRIDANMKNSRDAASPARLQHKYSIQAKGGKLVSHQVGSYSLQKKIEHEQERQDLLLRPPYKSNFSLDGILGDLGIDDVNRILGNNTNKLEVSECERIQAALQVLSENLITEIARSGQTIVMRENAAEVIDFNGRGLGFYIHKIGDTDARTGIVGFIDTMSVRDRSRAA